MVKHGTPMSCAAFQRAMDVLGRPWTALILQSLRDGPRRFGEMASGAEGLSDKVLSGRLKELEARGLILRRVEPGPPVRVSYELTDKGRGFGAVADAIRTWGEALVDGPELDDAPAETAREAS